MHQEASSTPLRALLPKLTLAPVTMCADYVFAQQHAMKANLSLQQAQAPHDLHLSWMPPHLSLQLLCLLSCLALWQAWALPLAGQGLQVGQSCMHRKVAQPKINVSLHMHVQYWLATDSFETLGIVTGHVLLSCKPPPSAGYSRQHTGAAEQQA